MRRLLVSGLLGGLMACAGPQGEPGPAGADGMNGTNGAAGTMGANGSNGVDGMNGANGVDGMNGASGSNGAAGDAGLSAWVSGAGVRLRLDALQVDGGTPSVDLTITDLDGAPLDVTGRLTSGRVALSFLFATAGHTDAGTLSTWSPLGSSTARPALDVAGSLITLDVAQGRYRFVSRDPLFGASPERAVVASASRTVGVDTFVDSAELSTGARGVVEQARCASCHGALTHHAQRFDAVSQCLVCHQPGIRTVSGAEGLDFMPLMHRLHAGAGLASVVQGTPLQLGLADGGVKDFTTVVFPQPVKHCVACHAATTEGDVWRSTPTLETCTTCHDRTGFTSPTPQGFVAHPVATTSGCSLCHTPTVIEGQHADPTYDAGMPTVALELRSVTSSAPGQTPRITFRVTSDGAPFDLIANPLRQLRFTLAGPNADLASATTVIAQGSTPTGTLSAVDAANGVFAYQLAVPISAAATGSSTVMADGYRDVTLGSSRTLLLSTPLAFAVTDPQAVPRRTVVDPARCDACHLQLNHHGVNRGAASCALCHFSSNDNSDRVSRLEGTSVQAPSVDFKVMIHKLHRGRDLSQPYALFGFPAPSKANPLGTPVPYDTLRMPRSVGECAACHVANTVSLPLGPRLPTVLQTQECVELVSTDADDYCDQRVVSATKLLPPETAVCTSCHDQPWVAAHAEINTSLAGVESCTTCHGPGAQVEAHR